MVIFCKNFAFKLKFNGLAGQDKRDSLTAEQQFMMGPKDDWNSFKSADVASCEKVQMFCYIAILVSQNKLGRFGNF